MIEAVALLSVFGLGISFSVLGALKLELTKALDIDDAQFEALRSRVDLCGRQLGGFISYLEKHKDRRRVKKSAVEYEIEEWLAG